MKAALQRAIRFVAREIKSDGIEHRLQDRAWKEAADFIYPRLNRDCEFFDSSHSIRKHAFNSKPLEGLVLEFGVHQGLSIGLFSQLLKNSNDARTIFGFDNFTGLTEDWTGMRSYGGHETRAQFFDLKGKPIFTSDNVEYIIGDIENTLEMFLTSKQNPLISFIHIDTDTYTPANVILKNCRPLLGPGSVILFDQLLGYPGYEHHEYAALTENLTEDQYKFIGFGIAQERSNLVKAALVMT